MIQKKYNKIKTLTAHHYFEIYEQIIIIHPYIYLFTVELL
jgi:hypothetical protein